MSLDALICFGLCGFLVLFQAVFSRNFLSPALLYTFVIAGTLGIAFLRLHPAMTPFHMYTWFIIGSSSLAFIGGAFIARFFFWARAIPLPYSCNNPRQIDDMFSHYLWKRHLLWTASIVAFYGVAAFRFLYKYDAPTLFSEHFQDLVGQKGMDIGYFFVAIMMYPLMLMLLFPALSRKTGLPSWIRWLLKIAFVFLLGLGFAFWPVRGALMHIVVFVVAFVNIAYAKIRTLHLLFLAVLAGLLFMGVASLKDQIAEFDIYDPDVWKLPYSYIANNYWNLDYAVNPPPDRELHPTTWGYNQASILGMDLWPYWPSLPKAMNWDGVFNQRVQKVGGLNTHGYWWRLYKDFWVFGVTLFPLLGGLWQGWLYNRIRFTPSFPHLLVYSFATVFIVMAFFGDFWALVSTPFYLLILWFVGKNCTIPVKVVTDEN